MSVYREEKFSRWWGWANFWVVGGTISIPRKGKPWWLIPPRPPPPFFFGMFYIRTDKNSKHDTLKQISLCRIWNTLGRSEHPGMGMPPMLEQDTSYVCMNQFLASMEVYPHTKYSTSQPYSFFRYCQYHFDILWI